MKKAEWLENDPKRLKANYHRRKDIGRYRFSIGGVIQFLNANKFFILDLTVEKMMIYTKLFTFENEPTTGTKSGVFWYLEKKFVKFFKNFIDVFFNF